MPIIVNCPTCGIRLNAPDNMAGRMVKCSKCASGFTVPEPAMPAQEIAAIPSSPPPLQQQPPADMMRCPYCAEQILAAARKCKHCGESLDEDDRPRRRRPRPRRSSYDYRGEPDEHRLSPYPTAVLILLHFLTLGIFTFIWLNLMHGKMPRNRPDDPSAGKAIGFLFIPFFNLYWVFFTYHRLCVRINGQRRFARLHNDVPTGLAIAMCIVMIIPYVGLISFVTLSPIFAGIVQSKVNELCEMTRRDDERDYY